MLSETLHLRTSIQEPNAIDSQKIDDLGKFFKSNTSSARALSDRVIWRARSSASRLKSTSNQGYESLVAAQPQTKANRVSVSNVLDAETRIHRYRFSSNAPRIPLNVEWSWSCFGSSRYVLSYEIGIPLGSPVIEFLEHQICWLGLIC